MFNFGLGFYGGQKMAPHEN